MSATGESVPNRSGPTMEVAISSGTRILVVDDEPVITQLFSMLLTDYELDVYTAHSVADAMKALDEEPALAIIDKNLPDGSGLDVLRTLRERWPKAEALLVTGYPSFQSAVEALRLGASDYVLKPLSDLTELWHKVRLALERRTLLLEREKTLEELRRAHRLQQLAAHSEMMAELGRLLATLVHEIRSPLALVTSYLDMALDALRSNGAASEREIRYLEDAMKGAEQLEAIVRDVRRVSRVDAYDAATVTSVEVKDLVESALLLTRGSLTRFVEVQVELADDLWVTGSRARLTQVLINLLVNAAQALDGAGKVQIRGAREDLRVRVDVEDDGPGIPAEVLSQIFEPFFTTKREDEATGLGLAIARETIEELGGKLTVRSEPGKGSCFTIVLPSAKP